MKTCLNCQRTASRRVKGCCPNCGAPVFIDKQVFRPESDKDLSKWLVNAVNNQLKQSLNLDYLPDNPKEVKMSYKVIDACRNMVNKNGGYVTLDSLVFEFWKQTIERRDIKTLLTLVYNQDYLAQAYAIIQRKAQEKKAYELLW